MKRIVALILTLLMVLGMVGCGSNASEDEQIVESTPEPATEESWELAYYVDDFGDPTDEAYLRSKPISGTFSNTATQNSPLTVILLFDPFFSYSPCYTLDDDGTFHSVDSSAVSRLSFRLLEYGESKAVCYSSDDIILKVKIGDETFSSTLYARSSNADPCLLGYEFSQSSDDAPIRDFIEALLEEQEIKCVIEIGSSKYNFAVNGTGFLEQYRELHRAYGIVPQI